MVGSFQRRVNEFLRSELCLYLAGALPLPRFAWPPPAHWRGPSPEQGITGFALLVLLRGR